MRIKKTMAILDYNRRLTNLQSRKYDPGLNESAVTRNFSAVDIPPDVKYLFESMMPIGQKYNAKTILAAENVKAHLVRDFKLSFNMAYRTQGSVMTNTNVKVHSDFDLLTIIDGYYYPQTSTGTSYAGNPKSDIEELLEQATAIMKLQYDKVDDSGDKCISIENQNLRRKVDIVFAYWYNSDKYEETKDEYYRGVYLYDFPKRSRSNSRDFPFATIHNVNIKGDSTRDGMRKGIRLLKNLRADADAEFELLKSFQLSSIVYGIENSALNYNAGDELRIAQVISGQLKNLIEDPVLRTGLWSPNGTEHPLTSADTVPEMIRLKADLDQLIEDAAKDIAGSYILQRTILSY